MKKPRVTPADLEEIRTLRGRYFRYVDTKDWDRVVGLYTVDARFEGFSFDSSSPEIFVSEMAAFAGGMMTVHQGFNPELKVLSADLVRGLWAMHDYLRWPPDFPGYRAEKIPGQVGINGYGHYQDEYSRTADGWRISFQRLSRLHLDPIVLPPGQPTPTFEFETLWRDWLD